MLEYMYITNNPEIAQIIDELGVERVWIDLEVLGKEERQKNYDSVKSKHSIQDIVKIKPLLKNAKLQVRINPMNKNSKDEIEQVIAAGCDYIMLPMYKTVEEVQSFLDIVQKRVKTILLLETQEAAEIVDDVLNLDGVDEMHIGLNDLHLSMGKQFMFELLADGTVELLCKKMKAKGIPYGFGGIARLGQGTLPAEYIIAEHCKMGSTRAILSRSFCNVDNFEEVARFKEHFDMGLKDIRQYEKMLLEKHDVFFENNSANVRNIVGEIVNKMNG